MRQFFTGARQFAFNSCHDEDKLLKISMNAVAV